MKLEVLYEDSDLLAVNKPAGLLAVPDRWDKSKENLVALLQAERPRQYLSNVHRLDRDTSGVFLLAKNSDCFRRLTLQFREQQIHKWYWALVHGEFEHESLLVDEPIGPDRHRPGCSRLDRHGKPARSLLRPLKRFRGYTWMEVETESGRLHQVRVHCQAVGHPLVGDTEYGGAPLFLRSLKRGYKAKANEPERPLIARPALHAARLTLCDPPLTITAPLPKDLRVALKYLEKFARR